MEVGWCPPARGGALIIRECSMEGIRRQRLETERFTCHFFFHSLFFVSDSTHKVQSCKRTRTDEDYLMVQLQLFCLVIGSLTYRQVKRQKQLYASGFDQRKESSGRASSQYSSNSRRTTGTSNMEKHSTAEERVPLANDDQSGIEVVWINIDGDKPRIGTAFRLPNTPRGLQLSRP